MLNHSLAQKTFIKRKIHLTDIPIFFPLGYEKIYLISYIALFPYIVGIFFTFFYIADAKRELFLALNEEASFLFSWAIGYEIIALCSLFYILISSIVFAINKPKNTQKINFSKH